MLKDEDPYGGVLLIVRMTTRVGFEFDLDIPEPMPVIVLPMMTPFGPVDRAFDRFDNGCYHERVSDEIH